MGIEVVHGTRGTKGSTEMWYRGWYRNTHTHYYSYITTYFICLVIFFFFFKYIYIYIFFVLFVYRTNVYWIVITGGGHRRPKLSSGARTLPLLPPPLPRAGGVGQSIMVDRST